MGSLLENSYPWFELSLTKQMAFPNILLYIIDYQLIKKVSNFKRQVKVIKGPRTLLLHGKLLPLNQ